MKTESVHQNIKNLQVYGDSELVIKQMNNLYKVKAEKLLPLFNKAKKLQTNFNSIQFQHIYRKDNARADHLSNIALNLCF